MSLRRLAFRPLPLLNHQLAPRVSSLISQRLSQSSRMLSTSTYPKPAKPPNQNQEMPMAKFSELGASRTVKIVVIIVLTIGGTLETIFWAKIIWRKFFREKEEGEEGDGS